MMSKPPQIPSLALALAALASIGCSEEQADESFDQTEFRGLADGLELHWTFEDRSGNQILDMSGKGRHGTLQGGGSFVTSPSGEALSLDGIDDYVSFAGPRAPSIYGGVEGAFTVSATVRAADVAKYNTLCFGCGPFNTMYVGTTNYGSRVMAAIFDQGTNGVVWPWTSQALTSDTWVEVTMIVEGGVGTRYYLDCTLNSETLDPDVGLKDYGSSSLGRNSDPSRWFEGEVDELRVWNRALSEAELAELCPAPPDDGLELHWTFEDRDGDQILDLSGNNRHGTLQGGAAIVSSPVGEAVSLDGVDDYVSLVGPRAPSLYGGVNGAFTVSTRVRVDNASKDNTLCFGCGPFNSMYVGTASHGARAMAAIFDQGTNGVVWPWTTQSLVDDTWVEVTMVVEGGVRTRYYLDCALDSETLDPDVGLKDYGSSSVGRGSSANRWFGGEIDELRVWNRALSEAEIAELCPTEPTLADGLELHWTFEDRSGNTILDLSGNNRNGTLQGGGSFVSSPFGDAVALDGVNDYISYAEPGDPALYGGPQGDVTISSYVRVSDVTRTNTLCVGCGPIPGMYVGVLSQGEVAMGRLALTPHGFLYPGTDDTLSNDTWVEFTMVVDGGVGVRIYLDGELASEVLNPNIVLVDSTYAAVGQGSASNQWFGGEIDELRIWNRALSEAQVAEIVEGRPSLETGLQLYWTFEDRSTNTIADLSGNNRTGTNNGGTFVSSPIGEAISLDGVDDYVSLIGPRDPALYGGVDGAFTISSRLRVSDVNAVSTLCYGCGPFNTMFVGNYSGGSRAWAKLFDQISSGFLSPFSSNAIVNDTWVEVTMTVDGTTGARLYLDCAFDAELLDPDIGLKNYNYSSVGQGISPSTWYRGEIDNLRVWDRVLTDDEITLLCQ